ncbi:glycosyltransferase family 2 protein [Mycolicibacterium sp. CBM1]
MSIDTPDRDRLARFFNDALSDSSPFWTSRQPVLWLAAHDLVREPETYYCDVASALGYQYISDIPVMMDDSASVANLIGPSILTKLSFFVFRQDGEFVVACADPFVRGEIIAICRSHLDEDARFRIVMASLSVIREAISLSVYTTTRAKAETSLSFAAPEFSSRGIINSRSKAVLLLTVTLVVGLVVWRPDFWVLAFFVIINVLYFVFMPFRFAVCLRALWTEGPSAADELLAELPDVLYPTYTVLVPGYDEARIVPSLIRALRNIDYPPDKLDIKLIVEVSDRATIEAYENEGIDGRNIADAAHTIFHLVKVPNGQIATKPRACNYALEFARGTMTVIYDAEDRPDPKQLKMAFLRMVDEPLNTLCLQAKLNFYNPGENLLTRFFALEYGFWYDFMLPGLRAWNIPIPLGGTSNHFVTEALRRVGGWDAYNVTEDADLGWRLSRLGYRTAMLDSYTLEEANSQLWNWITQRTRWQKGFLITSLVHMRSPISMIRRLGLYGFVSSSAVFLSNFLLPLINPLLWLIFALWYVPALFGLPGVGLGLSAWMALVGLLNLLIGNGLFFVSYLISAVAKRQWSAIALAPLMPIYWLLIGIAAYRSLFQVITSPYRWEKTKHGLSITDIS